MFTVERQAEKLSLLLRTEDTPGIFLNSLRLPGIRLVMKSFVVVYQDSYVLCAILSDALRGAR